MKTYELKSKKRKLDAIIGIAQTGSDLKESPGWVDSAALSIIHVPDGFTPAQGRQGTIFEHHAPFPPSVGTILRKAASIFIRGEVVAFAETNVVFEHDLTHLHDYIESHRLGRTFAIGTKDFVILSCAVLKSMAESGELDRTFDTEIVSHVAKAAKARVSSGRYHCGAYLNIGHPRHTEEWVDPAPFSFSESTCRHDLDQPYVKASNHIYKGKSTEVRSGYLVVDGDDFEIGSTVTSNNLAADSPKKTTKGRKKGKSAK